MLLELYQQADLSRGKTQCIVIIATFFFFVLVYGTSILVSSLFGLYRQLSTREKVFWNLTVARAVFGTYTAVMCAYCLLTQNELFDDVLFGTTKTSHLVVCNAVGFFLFECLAFYGSAAVFGKMDRTLAVHHILALICYGRSLYLQTAYFFGICGLVLEMTTPFTCICWGLLKAKLSKTRLWVANQWLMVHLFHCRSFIECYVWYKCWMHWNYIWTKMPTDIFILQFVSLTILSLVLTPYWTYKKTLQLLDPTDWNHPERQAIETVKGDVSRASKDKSS